jgi:hypothetical protein
VHIRIRSFLLRAALILIAAAAGLVARKSGAVILYATGDPAVNTTAPGGELTDSGWQYQGDWGGFLGTPIAPQFFITAKHVGNNGTFNYAGVTYRVVRGYEDPGSDLVIWQIDGAFPSFAPLYTGRDELGQRMVLFGRGTRRGAEVTVDGERKGWKWGDGDGVRRWGENVVAQLYPYGAGNFLLRATFDANGLTHECHLSGGDSGGAAFINDAAVWKLAGINFGVDGPYYADPRPEPPAVWEAFHAALFDQTGLYYHDGNDYVLITSPNPLPNAFYPTRLSSKLAWIASVIAAPVLALEGDSLTLTHTRLVTPASDLTYVVESSSDLISWQVAATSDEFGPVNGTVQTVKSSVLITGDRMFLRLRTTRPQ